jgi:hypothetical protein
VIRNAYKISVGKSERKKLLGTTRHKWDNTIKVDSISTGCEGIAEFIWLRTGTSGGLL